MSFRLKKLRVLTGTSGSLTSIDVDVPRILLVTGPNNCGKTLFLQEIYAWLVRHKANYKLISELQIDIPQTAQELESLVEPLCLQKQDNEFHMWNGSAFKPIVKPSFRAYGEWSVHNNYIREILNCLTCFASREELVSTSNSPHTSVRFDGSERPQNLLHLFQLYDDKRFLLRKKLKEVVGLDFCIDMTSLSQLFPRFSRREPTKDEEFDVRSDFFRRNEWLDPTQLGLGFQMYVGAMMLIHSFDHKIILFDEPDAFMHPPLKRRLARELCREIDRRQGSLIVATHSEDFVLGCLESSDDVAVIRLGFQQNMARMHVLQNSDVRSVMLDPATRSTSPLRGLFHESAVITEGETDRAFTMRQIIYSIAAAEEYKIVFFLQGGGWQKISLLVRTLRKAGIPTAGIYDFDVLILGDSWDAHKIYENFCINLEEAREFEQARSAICGCYAGLPKEQKKNGVDALSSTSDQLLVRQHIEKLAEYGMFIVPTGSVNSWLRNLLPTQVSKTAWLPSIFEAVSNKREILLAELSRGAYDDVWHFMEKNRVWISNENRKGMPRN